MHHIHHSRKADYGVVRLTSLTVPMGNLMMPGLTTLQPYLEPLHCCDCPLDLANGPVGYYNLIGDHDETCISF